MGLPGLVRWREWPLVLRLRRSDWLCEGNHLQTPTALPAGWYVLSIRCPSADHSMLSILPGQQCSLGRGQLRRRVLRLRNRQRLRLVLEAPLHHQQVDRLDLLHIPGWRAWQLINRKLRRFHLLERGICCRRDRWRRYNRLLARSGASRVTLAQWLRHFRLSRLPDQAITSAFQLPSGWTLLRDSKHLLNPEAINDLPAACSRTDLDLVHGDCLEVDSNRRPSRAVLLPIWDQELFVGNPDCHGVWFVRQAVLDRCRHALRSSGLPETDVFLRFELLHQLNRDRVAHLPQLLSIRQLRLDSASLDHWEVALRQWLKQRRPDLQAYREGNLGLRLEPMLSVKPSTHDLIRVSIIIPTRDRCDLLRLCLESIKTRTLPLDHGAWEVIVIDNGSTDVQTLQYLQELEDKSIIRIIRDAGPFNYSRLNNKAVSLALGRVLVFMNNDTEVISGNWLQRIVCQAERQDVGAVGACLLYGDGTIQHGGVLLGIGGIAGHAHKYRDGSESGELHKLRLQHECAAVTGAVLAVEKHKFVSVKGFNEISLAVNYNDVDLCLRLSCQGWRTLCCPDVRLFHHESRSRGAPVGFAYHQWQQERSTLCRLWGALIDDDPWYNPHFTRHEENYSLQLLDKLPNLRTLNTKLLAQ